MSNEIEDISLVLLEVYKKNMIFLKESFNDIYERVEKLSNDIESNKQEEKYALEMRNGYLDILNLKNNGYFYNTNTYIDAEERANALSFENTNSLDLLRKGYNGKELLNSELYKDVTPIIDYLNKVIDYDNIKFEKIFKFIYIGTGLGLHIQEIDKKVNSLSTLIIEEELEIFRLSLFTTDYTVFESGDRKLFLSIGENPTDLKTELYKFTDHQKYMNFNIKYTTLLQSGLKKKEEIEHFYALNGPTMFPYKIVLENLEKLINFVKNEERFLNQHKMSEKLILKDKKVLMISAGPSVDNYIDWISKNQNKFVIVCVDVIVKKLEKNNIIPDIVVSIDPATRCADFLTTKDENFLNNSAILFLSQQSPETIKVVENKHYYFSQVMPLVDEIGYLGSTPNVGTYSFELAMYLGARELFFIGNDAAFNQDTGSRYADDSSFVLTDVMEEKVSNKDSIHLRDVIEVKGNFRETVKTNRDLSRFRDSYEEAIQNFNYNNIDFVGYNLSDGAHIEGLTSCTFDELESKMLNSSDLNKNIIQQMDKVSQVVKSLDVDEDIRILSSIIMKIKKYQKIKISTKNDFLSNKLDLMIFILESTKKMDSTVYSNLFLDYTSLIDIYVNFFLNLKQKDLHTKEEINKISQMWSRGTLTLFKDIKNAFK